MSQTIEVLIRVRPGTDSSSSSSSSSSSVSVDEAAGKVSVQRVKGKGLLSKGAEFTFTKVFGPSADQRAVYSSGCGEVAQLCLGGVSCCVMTYGQTNTGKTFTMYGAGWDAEAPNPNPAPASSGKDRDKDPLRSSSSNPLSEKDKDKDFESADSGDEGSVVTIENSSKPVVSNNEGLGIVPRCISDLFDALEAKMASSKNGDYTVNFQILQIYNEKIYDLLHDKKRQNPLPIREGGNSETWANVHVRGLSVYRIDSKEDAFRLIKKAIRNKAVRSTDYNNVSSRAHTVLQLLVSIEEDSDEGLKIVRKSTLSLVDLAGSEKWRASLSVNGVADTDAQVKEMTNINTSLHVLGNCISGLIEHDRKHIPYRDSVLTRLLQTTLSGQGKSIIVATIHSDQEYLDENYSTLQFASRASKIKVSLSANWSVMGQDDRWNFSEAQKTIKQLKQQILDFKQNASLTGSKMPSVCLTCSETTTKLEELEAKIEVLLTENKSLKAKLQSMTEDSTEGVGSTNKLPQTLRTTKDQNWLVTTGAVLQTASPSSSEQLPSQEKEIRLSKKMMSFLNEIQTNSATPMRTPIYSSTNNETQDHQVSSTKPPRELSEKTTVVGDILGVAGTQPFVSGGEQQRTSTDFRTNQSTMPPTHFPAHDYGYPSTSSKIDSHQKVIQEEPIRSNSITANNGTYSTSNPKHEVRSSFKLDIQQQQQPQNVEQSQRSNYDNLFGSPEGKSKSKSRTCEKHGLEDCVLCKMFGGSFSSTSTVNQQSPATPSPIKSPSKYNMPSSTNYASTNYLSDAQGQLQSSTLKNNSDMNSYSYSGQYSSNRTANNYPSNYSNSNNQSPQVASYQSYSQYQSNSAYSQSYNPVPAANQSASSYNQMSTAYNQPMSSSTYQTPTFSAPVNSAPVAFKKNKNHQNSHKNRQPIIAEEDNDESEDEEDVTDNLCPSHGLKDCLLCNSQSFSTSLRGSLSGNSSLTQNFGLVPTLVSDGTSLLDPMNGPFVSTLESAESKRSEFGFASSLSHSQSGSMKGGNRVKEIKSISSMREKPQNQATYSSLYDHAYPRSSSSPLPITHAQPIYPATVEVDAYQTEGKVVYEEDEDDDDDEDIGYSNQAEPIVINQGGAEKKIKKVKKTKKKKQHSAIAAAAALAYMPTSYTARPSSTQKPRPTVGNAAGPLPTLSAAHGTPLKEKKKTRNMS